jgi:hypothetical protein
MDLRGLNWERVAIILETASFFLVTIDLFGRKRIEGVQVRAQSCLSRVKALDIKKEISPFFSRDPSEKRSDFSYGIMMQFLFLAILVGGEAVCWHKGGWWRVAPALAALVAAVPLTAGFMPLSFWSVVALEKAMDAVFSVLIGLFTKLKLEGLMVLAGALLFVGGKTIAFLLAGSK